MPSIAENLRLHGTKTGFRFNGVWITVQSTGQPFFVQFGTDKDLIRLETDLGNDPREADFVHFIRDENNPPPNLNVEEILVETDRPENKWRITSDREDHPYKPTVFYSVTKIVAGLDE